MNMVNNFEGKDILVTGGCGSIGSEIVKRLLVFSPKRIRVFDHNENGLFNLQHKLNSSVVRYFIGDIRDKTRLIKAMRGVDIVFHTAALKHVPLCEYNPDEAVYTNIIGTMNVADAARISNVEKFVLISTDKAVKPINTMGATKNIAEKIVLNSSIGDFRTKYSCVRFGNVLNSSGSVIPTFINQIKKGGPVTITSEKMTRFFMTIPNAIDLVLKAVEITNGREIFVLKMDAINIVDLADVLIEELAPKYGFNPFTIEKKITGPRPGEKYDEVLIADNELEYVEETDDMFIIRPFILTPHYVKDEKKTADIDISQYNSKYAKLLSKDEIKTVLKNIGVL